MLSRLIVVLALIAENAAAATEQAQLHIALGQNVVQAAAFSPDGKFAVMSRGCPARS
jgi:hypothetical protein